MGRKVALLCVCLTCLLLLASPVSATWVPDGVPLCTSTGDQSTPKIVSDGAGGAIVAWREVGTLEFDLYAQRIGAGGTVMWAINGIAVSTAPEWQAIHTVTPDGFGGVIIAWIDSRDDAGDIYAQRIDGSGNILWAANGISICSAAGEQNFPHVACDGTGGAVIAWTDFRSGADTDIYAQRVNSGGAVQWTSDGVILCGASGDQYNVNVLCDGMGRAIVAWSDDRGSNIDVYAQQIDASGTIQWAANGVTICSSTGDQYVPRIVSDGAGGTIIAWRDMRNGYEDIYAQRVDVGGAGQWTGNGIAVHNTTTGIFHFFNIVADNNGGAIVTWQDGRDIADYDVYAQRINPSGTTLWASGGLPVCTAVGDQKNPDVASDGSDGAIITWRDERGSDADVYAQRINGSGAIQWTADGSSVCTAGGDQDGCTIAATNTDGAIIAWSDPRATDKDIYAMHVGESLVGTGPQKPRVSLILNQNHPNPFNPATYIHYYLPEKAHVTLEIFDISGRRVVRLVDRVQGDGHYDADWDGLDSRGKSVSSGVYFYRLKAGNQAVSRKMVLTR